MNLSINFHGDFKAYRTDVFLIEKKEHQEDSVKKTQNRSAVTSQCLYLGH